MNDFIFFKLMITNERTPDNTRDIISDK